MIGEARGGGQAGCGHRRAWALSLVVGVLVLASASAQDVVTPGMCCDGAACNKPGDWKTMFACPVAHWDAHMKTMPRDWYTISNPGSTVPKVCLSGTKKYSACASDADCGSAAGSCALPETAPGDYVKEHMSCCRHCVWDMKYPVGSPIQVTAGPMLNETSELASIPMLNCNTFKGAFTSLDTNGDGFLTRDEFQAWLDETPQRQMVQQHMLDPEAVYWIVDLNKDKHISEQEYMVLRHFWTPTTLARTAPSQNLLPLAEAQLGGFFYDNATVSVWVTTANNLMLRLYITNKWNSAAVRQPRKGEEKEHRRLRDLDGSQRISLDEHYFGEFADINGDGVLSQEEFDLSLYSEKTIEGTSFTTKSSFAHHDLDGSGTIDYMERKRVMADRNEDGNLNKAEWEWADYPEEYGPFRGHVSEDGTLKPEQYRYYMSYHGCTVRGSIAYSRSISEFPWDPSCPITVVTRVDPPFVTQQDPAAAPARRVNDNRRSNHGIDASNGGFAMRVLGNVTERLLWEPKVRYIEGLEYGLTPPDMATNSFGLALLTSYMRTPDGWTCSESLFPEDGLVVVTRSADVQIDLYWIAARLVISPHFINFFCSLFFTVLVVGHIMWAVERWTNAEIFRSFYGEGVMDGLWWAIVTQTTVGYGDKAPTSGLGKTFAILWMLFGLIMFGVFSGQVTTFIQEETAVNGISDAASIAGFSVGTMANTRDLLLSQVFSFENVPCADLKECTDRLANYEMSAIVAPRSEVMSFFQTSGLTKELCGNPFKIVGRTIPTSAIPQLPPSIRVCSYSKSVYAGVYLTEGVTKTLQKMKADGSLAAIMAIESESLYPPPNLGSDGECNPPSPWKIDFITTALVILLLYAILITLSESPRAQEYLGNWFGGRFGIGLTEAQKQEELAAAQEAEKAGEAEAEGEKPNKADEEVAKLPGLTADHAEEMIEASKKLGVFTAMQATDIRRMQREMKEQRYLLERMLKFFGLCGLVVLCALGAMVGILIIVWGDQLQVAQYQ